MEHSSHGIKSSCSVCNPKQKMPEPEPKKKKLSYGHQEIRLKVATQILAGLVSRETRSWGTEPQKAIEIALDYTDHLLASVFDRWGSS